MKSLGLYCRFGICPVGYSGISEEFGYKRSSQNEFFPDCDGLRDLNQLQMRPTTSNSRSRLIMLCFRLFDNGWPRDLKIETEAEVDSFRRLYEFRNASSRFATSSTYSEQEVPCPRILIDWYSRSKRELLFHIIDHGEQDY